MIRNTRTGVYTYNGEEVSFNFYTSISAYDKVRFVNTVVNTLVDDNYISVIRNLIFDFEIIDVFTDIDTSNIKDINAIEQFLEETNIVEIVKANIDSNVIEELNKAVDDNIEYRTGIHKNPISESLSNLLNTLEEKVSGIDTEKMMEMAQIFSNVSGELTADKMLEAYSKSDLFKNLLASRKK